MSNGRTMFKVTAQNCKEWADTANDDAHDDVLEQIIKAAHEGKYNIIIENLSEKSKHKLEENGFNVTKYADDWHINWL